MSKDKFRKQHGLPAPEHPSNREEPAVSKLPPPPEKVKEVNKKYEPAWKAWDTAMVVSDKDRVLADRVFNRTLNQKKESTDEGEPE